MQLFRLGERGVERNRESVFGHVDKGGIQIQYSRSGWERAGLAERERVQLVMLIERGVIER